MGVREAARRPIQGFCVFQAAVFVTRRVSEANAVISSLTLRLRLTMARQCEKPKGAIVPGADANRLSADGFVIDVKMRPMICQDEKSNSFSESKKCGDARYTATACYTATGNRLRVMRPV
jgi:hypothetical protein